MIPTHLPPYSNRRYLDAVDSQIVVFDGAMGTSIQGYKLGPADFGGEHLDGCNDYLVITRPDVIEEIHASFLAVGCQVVETCTFRSNRLTLGEYGLGDQVLEINRAAASLARRVADRFEQQTGTPRFVAGSIGPSGKLPSSSEPGLSEITFDELAELFYEQAQGLVEGGVDVLLIETSQDILEVRAAIHGIVRYFLDSGHRLPIQAQVTLDTTGRMLLGTDIASAIATLEALPIDVIGLNCSTGPEHMRQPVQYMVENATKPISIIPNAGLPLNVDGEAVYPMLPEPMAQDLAEFVDWGVRIVGGCCGTTPAHLQALVAKVKDKTPKPLAQPGLPQLSSAMRATPMLQNPAPTLVGERVNSQGSRKVKRLLLEDDYNGLVDIAREQIEGGAHVLDICVALTEREDEREQMQKTVKLIAQSVDAPLMIDTTEAEVVEAALAVYPGRAIINGNNLENGRERIDSILPIAKKHGAAVLSMTIDRDSGGMAKTAEMKLAVARKIHDIAVHEYGMIAEDLVFDALVFTLATGDAEMADSAIQTLEGIKLIKQNLPGVMTCLGVSNVSFGLSPAARAVLNSVFLYNAVQYGLDMAIVNPVHITPYAEIPAEQRTLADDLVFNRHPDALAAFIQYFEQNQVSLGGKEVADPTAEMSSEQALHWHIVHRKKEGVEALIDLCLQNQDAVGVLNGVLLPAMKEVGDKFGAGELILPFVLQSAEVMKKSVAYLEQFLDKVEGVTKGVVVLATVYGDVHDIGKGLVKTILSNNGYTVHDLGKQVPANTIIEAAQQYKADAIGLSALLVSTSKQMPLIVNELARRGLEYPVLIGGAAINRRFGQRILFLEDSGEAYGPGVFYCNDAFEGLSTMDKIMDKPNYPAYLEAHIAAARQEMNKPAKPKKVASVGRSSTPPAPNVPTPPFWGAKTIRSIPLETVFPFLHLPELYRLSWGAKNTHGAEWVKLQAEFEERRLRMQKEALRAKSLLPQAVYGYFPAQATEDELVIFDPEAYQMDRRLVEVERFGFPRQPDGEGLSITDYFLPLGSEGVDVCALQIVTAGHVADEVFAGLQAADNYSEAYFFHGLAVQTAEATASYVNAHLRRELGLEKDRGLRYSWGYPACPDLEDHAIVFRLLPQATTELGMNLTEAFQLLPEQSTAAIFTHHPAAKYFAVGVNRVEQLLEA